MLNLYKQVRGAHRYLIIRTPGGFVPTLNTSCAGWGILGWDNKDECGLCYVAHFLKRTQPWFHYVIGTASGARGGVGRSGEVREIWRNSR